MRSGRPARSPRKPRPRPPTRPPRDAVGPRELQNFSLKGTVTRAAEQPAGGAGRAAGATHRARPRPNRARLRPRLPLRPWRARHRRLAGSSTAPPQRQAAEQPRQAAGLVRSSRAAAGIGRRLHRPRSGHDCRPPLCRLRHLRPSPPPATSRPSTSFRSCRGCSRRSRSALGGGFLFWRNRSRAALAGGPQVDAFSAPEPAPAPRPAPVPRARAAPPKAPAPDGLAASSRPASGRGSISASTRSAASLEERQADHRVRARAVQFRQRAGSRRAGRSEPVQCRADAGQRHRRLLRQTRSAPATALPRSPPLKRVCAQDAGRDRAASSIQAYEVGGRAGVHAVDRLQRALRWSGGEGQTSVSYLLGRDTKSEKMAPFRLDLGPRVFRGVAARPLPTGVRN